MMPFPVEIEIGDYPKARKYRVWVEQINKDEKVERYAIHGSNRTLIAERKKGNHSWNWNTVETPQKREETDWKSMGNILSMLYIVIEREIKKREK